jgi:hypothetical protein
MEIDNLYLVKEIPTEDYFETHFFNSKKFLIYQSSFLKKEIITIGIFARTTEELLAYLSFSIDISGLFNPVTGSFGGVVSKNSADVIVLNYLISKSLFFINNKFPQKNIFFKLAPFAFFYESAILANILFFNNFKVIYFDLNHHINIGPHDTYYISLGETKRKIYRRLISKGAIFKNLNIKFLPEVFDVIAKNRRSQNYPLTMSLESLKSLTNNFPDDIFLFGIYLENCLIASAICIKVTNEHLYVFYWGEEPFFRDESPVVMLAIEIHRFCYENKFKVLDLGTSSNKSEINYNLARFKKSLGCIASPKMSFSLF